MKPNTAKYFLAALCTSVVPVVVQCKSALLVIDVQDCFMEANGTTSGSPGSLAVADTAAIIPIINELRSEKSCLFDYVIRSQDYHPPQHISFGPTHGLDPFAHLAGKGELPLMCVKPGSGLASDASCCPTAQIAPYDCETSLCPSATSNFESPACGICKDAPEECFETTQAMWTNHCLQDGDSSFVPGLYTEPTDIVVQKGGNVNVDSYSAFMDNTRKLKTQLDDTLKDLEVTSLYILGIATDYCVYFSAMDALSLDYDVTVVVDATRGIAQATIDAAIADMNATGATLLNAADVLAMECPVMSGGATFSGLWLLVFVVVVVNSVACLL